MSIKFANYIRLNIVGGGVDLSQTTIEVDSVDRLPEFQKDEDYMYLVLVSKEFKHREIIKLESYDEVTKVLTVERGQDGTVPLTFQDNDYVESWITAQSLLDLVDFLEDTTSRINSVFRFEQFTIHSGIMDGVTLEHTPIRGSVQLFVAGGIKQLENTDFKVDIETNYLTWQTSDIATIGRVIDVYYQESVNQTST